MVLYHLTYLIISNLHRRSYSSFELLGALLNQGRRLLKILTKTTKIFFFLNIKLEKLQYW